MIHVKSVLFISFEKHFASLIVSVPDHCPFLFTLQTSDPVTTIKILKMWTPKKIAVIILKMNNVDLP